MQSNYDQITTKLPVYSITVKPSNVSFMFSACKHKLVVLADTMHPASSYIGEQPSQNPQNGIMCLPHNY